MIELSKKEKVYYNWFFDQFKKFRPDNFSDNGILQLFRFLLPEFSTEWAEGEIDVIGICSCYEELPISEVCDYFDLPEDENAIENLRKKTSIVLEVEGNNSVIVRTV